MLEGENAYYCEKCDKKVDTLKRTCIKKLPKYLIMTLKRFEYDFDKMIRVKVNCFPNLLYFFDGKFCLIEQYEMLGKIFFVE